MIQKQKAGILILMVLLIMGCQPKTNSNENNGKLQILTTTGMLKDAVQNLLGDAAEVNALMGPGVDPHLYQASPGDLAKLTKADVIVYNGLFLEGKLDNILKKLGEKKKVINFSSSINSSDLIEVTEKQYEAEIYDPHIWFDIAIWKQGMKGMGEELKAMNDNFKSIIDDNRSTYFIQLDSLKNELLNQTLQIESAKRILVTSHDAFQYFGRMLDIRVEALQGLSTATDFGLKDRKQLVDLIIEEQIKAIFIESSVGDKPIRAILSDCKERGAEVTLGGTLFSDAMGADGSPEGTYIGMLKHNVATIVKGLK